MKVNYTKANIYRVHYGFNKQTITKTIVLKPGINEIADNVYLKLIDKETGSKLFQHRLNTGDIVVHTQCGGSIKETSEGKTPEESKAFVHRSFKELLADIKNTFDKDLLLKYKDGEIRKTVLDAIDKQIDKITPKDEDFRTSEEKAKSNE